MIGAILFLILYVGVQFFHWFSLEAVSPYATYLFDAAWVLAVLIVFKKVTWLRKSSTAWFGVCALLLPLGWATHQLGRAQDILIPFDFHNSETLLFLLLVGPVLEELVFRGAMWRALEKLNLKPVMTALMTSAAFSYSHFQASFLAPDEFKPFIYYQTAYTFLLALVCAKVRIELGLLTAILVHALFNFGFWLG